MKKQKPILTLIITILLLISSFTSVFAQSSRVITIDFEGPLTPALVTYVQRSIRYAENSNAEAVIIQLDTPGGSIDLMNRIIQDIKASEVPVIVYVSPNGAIAGSAGTLITLAGHYAVMAPETAIGAASPVGSQGEDLGETIERKGKEILRASARSLAADRSEEAIQLAEATIEEAKAASAQEALEAGLIDYIADDLQDLLNWLDGKSVSLPSGERNLATKNLPIEAYDMSFIEQLLQLLTNPNILFLLIAIGTQAIYIELSNPGGWVAGFIGAVCLLLAIYGLGVLPVNWFGLLFFVVAFILFVLEIKTPTFGALTAAGVVSFIVGALVLFNNIETVGFQKISIPLVVGTAILLGSGVAVILTFALRALRQPPQTGMEAIIGSTGYVVTEIKGRGMVQTAGEQWGALSEDGKAIPEGTPIIVTGKEGINLIVKKRESSD